MTPEASSPRHQREFPFPALLFILVGLLIGVISIGLFDFLPPLHAQSGSSPLTVQPSTNRVGIGTTTPSYTLDVAGTVNATAFQGNGSQLTNLPVINSQWTTNGTSIYYNSGDIGVGTTSPLQALHLSRAGDAATLYQATGVTGVVPTTVTFNYTGAQQQWVVPAGVTSISVDARGASGGTNGASSGFGLGARVQTTLSVTPGETLYIYAGGAGTSVAPPASAPGGFNGGGPGGTAGYAGGWSASGGGASDIRRGGNAIANRVVVAGGGGGREVNFGGDGGNPNGYSGTSDPYYGTNPIINGGGATQSAGGNGGSGAAGAGSGTAGALGQGGSGGNSSYCGGTAGRAGGGGGGGYYGGGGAGGTCTTGGAGGGGGGSSYSVGTETIYTRAFQNGNGQVIITHNNTSGIVNWTAGLDHSDLGKFKISNSSALGGNDYVTVDTTGRIGVGTTAPTYKLEVVGQIRATEGTAIYHQPHPGCAALGVTTDATCTTRYDEWAGLYYNCEGTNTIYATPHTCNNTLLGRLMAP